ncbi:LDH2 family malate/lactate/ureidoglycolate dehydrogenase [Mycoplana sp. BE70]|uniref:Ldh family oxidoreductase n=1 Tax=Mycoplana sp. BE70 TaxID=2817775 RepID=UPI0028654F77|nr:Ldh family oxidoreductase [Mycoplana sp. BE70]MDR6756430.1 LDH2 family malate/lactate/ureidoglycolate dehydrogenase [Mycoplana sp. BE70]
MSLSPAAAEPALSRIYAKAEDAKAFATQVIKANGLPEADAAVVAGCLVRADLRGVDTHGLQYLPHYLNRVRKELINARPSLSLQKTTPVAGLVDGQNAFGFVTATYAMNQAIHMAREFGIGLVSVNNSTHFGMAACYVLQAVEAGYIALVFTNASRAMPPWGGKQALLGTSPFAAGAPSGKEVPYVLDMSPAVAARGKIRRAARHGQDIPLGYALDKEGRPTTDPNAALDGGVVLPIGGPKGSAISMLMDIFGGVFSGAAFAGGVANQFEDFERPQNVGHFFLAIRPGLFVTEDGFRQRMDDLVRAVHDCPRAEGFDEILMPGEFESRLEQDRLKHGIPYSPIDMARIQAEAASTGIDPLAVSEIPFGD